MHDACWLNIYNPEIFQSDAFSVAKGSTEVQRRSDPPDSRINLPMFRLVFFFFTGFEFKFCFSLIGKLEFCLFSCFLFDFRLFYYPYIFSLTFHFYCMFFPTC